MDKLKRSLWIILGLFLTFIIVACGSTSTSTGANGSGNNTSANPTATTNGNGSSNGNSEGPCGRYCSGATPTAKTSGASVSIKTATIALNGKSVIALTNSQGWTLYYRTADTASSVCSGACASAWPPLLSSSVPSSTNSLPGKLSLQKNANGSQIEYNSHPLYTYSGDSGPRQMNGECVGSVWFVVTSDLATGNPGQSCTNGY